MTVIRTKHNAENKFVQLNRKALWNESLSLKATGLWARCISRPDDWRFNVKELTTKCKEGRRAIDSAIQELIKNRYAIKVDFWKKDPTGKFQTRIIEYVFFEVAASDEEIQNAIEDSKNYYLDCGFGNLRGGNCRNDELQIEKETEREKEKKKITPIIPLKGDDEGERLAKFFHESILERKADFSKKPTEKWAKDFNALLKKRSKERILDVIDWISKDSFWSGILFSPSGILKHLDKLEAKMNQSQGNSWKNSKSQPKSLDYNPISLDNFIKEQPLLNVASYLMTLENSPIGSNLQKACYS